MSEKTPLQEFIETELTGFPEYWLDRLLDGDLTGGLLTLVNTAPGPEAELAIAMLHLMAQTEAIGIKLEENGYEPG